MNLWGWRLLMNVQVLIIWPRAVGCRLATGSADWYVGPPVGGSANAHPMMPFNASEPLGRRPF